MSKKTETKKALIVTEKQLSVIRDACELYGRIQIGQFGQFAEVVTQTGFHGFAIRHPLDDGQVHIDEQYEKDSMVRDCIQGMMDGIWRMTYAYDRKKTNECCIALDIWAVLDGRRDGGFHMGSEPLVQVKESDGDNG